MKKQLIWIYITVFVNIVSFGMVFPLLPLFAEAFGATPFQLGFLVSLFSLGQFFAAPVLGRLSDRVGRKPILLASVAGSALSFFIMGSAGSLMAVLLGRFFQGIASAGVFPVAVASIGDSTNRDERTKYVSRVTAMFALGFTIGPLFGGFLGSYGFSYAFFAAGAVALFNFFSVLLFLPESLTKKAERLALREGLFNFRQMIDGLRGDFGALFFLAFGWAFYTSNFQVAIPLFTAERFSAGPYETGLFFSSVGIASSLIQWVFLPRIVRILGDTKTILLGALLMIAGQVAAPFMASAFLFYAAFLVSVSGSSLKRPTINGMLSKGTHEGQGTTMGLSFSFESMGRFFGPLLAGATVGFFGLASPFFSAAFILAAGALLFWRVERARGVRI